jgi:uncharacterized protein (TIGR03083 family)
MDPSAIYAETRLRTAALVRGLTPELLDSRVPATPEWTVNDVVSHLTGNVSNILDDKIDGLGTEPWTAEQVEERRGRTLEEVLAEWEQKAPKLEATLEARDLRLAFALAADLATHEQDIRGAAALPGARDSAAVALAAWAFAFTLGERLREQSLPPLRVRADDEDLLNGDADASATVKADRFELSRALTGRRSVRQIRALDWDGDPTPYLSTFSHFAPRDSDLVE